MAHIALDIIVVGAGIAGLSAAIALSRAGHNVTVSCKTCGSETTDSWYVQVLEKSTFKTEAGFMISIGTTGLSVLTSFGEDRIWWWSDESVSWLVRAQKVSISLKRGL
jgi:salicylate hydroxylase